MHTELQRSYSHPQGKHGRTRLANDMIGSNLTFIGCQMTCLSLQVTSECRLQEMTVSSGSHLDRHIARVPCAP